MKVTKRTIEVFKYRRFVRDREREGYKHAPEPCWWIIRGHGVGRYIISDAVVTPDGLGIMYRLSEVGV